MTTFYRVCIQDYVVTDVLGHELSLKAGTKYLTTKEENGMVTVFTEYWHEVPITLFGPDEIQFSGSKWYK